MNEKCFQVGDKVVINPSHPENFTEWAKDWFGTHATIKSINRACWIELEEVPGYWFANALDFDDCEIEKDILKLF